MTEEFCADKLIVANRRIVEINDLIFNIEHKKSLRHLMLLKTENETDAFLKKLINSITNIALN
jgi:hypothetical protein